MCAMKLFRFFRRRRTSRPATGVRAYRERKEEARALVHARLAHWKAVFPFEYGQVRIKNQRRAWGSCSSKKNLNFNWRLVTLPLDLSDYVIVHELCHTIHLNHSIAFWNLLESYLPDSRLLRARLRRIAINGVIY